MERRVLLALAMQRFIRSSILSLSVILLAACGGQTESETITPAPAPSSSSSASPTDPPASPSAPSEPRSPQKVGELDAPSNVSVPFHVYVSNQSFDLDPVDIDLFIDGKKIVTGDFVVEGQHTWIQFDFDIAVGAHTIRAVTKKGNVEKTEALTIPAGEHWAVVNFWYYATAQGGQSPTPPDFSIDVMDSAPAFQ